MMLYKSLSAGHRPVVVRLYSSSVLWREKRDHRNQTADDEYDLRKRRVAGGYQGEEVPGNWQDQRDIIREVSDVGRDRRWEEALHLFAAVEDPNPVLYGATLDACAKSFQPTAAWKLFDGMPVKSVASYNILIAMHGRMRDASRAEELFREMQQQNLKPTVVTYTSLINAYGMAHQVEGVVRTLEAMHEQSVPADRVAYASALSGCAMAGDRDRTWELLGRMDALSLNPDVNQLTSLIVSCAMTKDETHAREALEELRKRGLRPTVKTYTALISCFDGPQALAKAEVVFQDMHREAIHIDVFAYNSLLKAAIISRESTRFQEILADMDAKGLQRGRATEILERQCLSMTEERARSSPYAAPSASAGSAQRLPPGWEETMDPGSGRPYYWRSSDAAGTVTWERPS